jgi:DNA-binding protein YbaB
MSDISVSNILPCRLRSGKKAIQPQLVQPSQGVSLKDLVAKAATLYGRQVYYIAMEKEEKIESRMRVLISENIKKEFKKLDSSIKKAIRDTKSKESLMEKERLLEWHDRVRYMYAKMK